MWNGDDFVVINTGHSFGSDESVDDRLFGRLHRRLEQRVHAVVRQHRHLRQSGCFISPGIGRREGDEDVARPIAGGAAGARDAERRAAGDALQLIRHQRRIGRHNDDDRADIVAVTSRVVGRNLVVRHLLADRHAGDAQLIAPPEIRLHQHADRVTAGLLIELTRGGADALPKSERPSTALAF